MLKAIGITTSLAIQGWQTRDVRDAIGAATADHQPDVILMMIGINDLRGNSITPALAASRVESAIGNARVEQPEVAVLLAEIPPENLVGDEVDAVQRFAWPRSAARSARRSLSVATVDLNTGFSIGEQTSDGLHPNNEGDRWLADRWATALSNLTGIAVADPYAPVNLMLATAGEGTLTVDPPIGPRLAGDTVTSTATPAPGWSFDRWLATPAIASDWWDPQWGYRIHVEIDAAGEPRTDALVSVPVDFSTAFAELGVVRTLDQASIRVVELGATGGIVDSAVPFQFDPGEDYEPSTVAAGNLGSNSAATGPAETREVRRLFRRAR